MSSTLNMIILEAIDIGLNVLGEGSKQAILFHIERNHGIKRGEIPQRLEAFHEALRSLLGPGGEVVESLIAKALYGQFDLDFERHENWTLPEYIKDMKSRLPWYPKIHPQAQSQNSAFVNSQTVTALRPAVESKVPKNMIALNLYSKLGLSLEPQENWTLKKYLDHAKKHMKAK
jgi:hypothetical protein